MTQIMIGCITSAEPGPCEQSLYILKRRIKMAEISVAVLIHFGNDFGIVADAKTCCLLIVIIVYHAGLDLW